MPQNGKRGRIELTDFEKAVVELRHSKDPPPNWSRMSEILKKDRKWVQRSYDSAVEKMSHLGEAKPPPPNSFEAEHPEKVGEFMAEIVKGDDSPAQIKALAIRLGITRDVASGIVKKLRTSLAPVRDDIRAVKRDYLKRRWGVVAQDALDAITPEKLEKANVRDLGILGGIATDKLLLLQGLPTQIVRTEGDRAKLSDLAFELVREMKRRGVAMGPDQVVLDVECTRVGNLGDG
jgi:hypothetical protein